MARWIESWMPGAASVGETPRACPGEQFGLPGSGPGSTAGLGRRVAALTVDWLLSYFMAGLFTGPDALGSSDLSWIVLGVWFVVTTAAVAAFGITPGMAVLGIRVASLDSTLVGVPRAVLRTAMITLVVPALARDADGRGWHDRATNTIVVRTRG
jgi:uncharacterized RDD family membrane protein YckC